MGGSAVRRVPERRRTRRCGAVAGALVLGWSGAAAQGNSGTFPTGQVVEDVVSLADTTQRYAVYVPTAYDTSTAWPVLFAMDPRGRALIPLRLFQDAAERLGYIIISSYNTASDVVGADPNEPAFTAMLDDAQRHFVIHPNRLYLTGFSGTARTSWSLARRLPGAAAGIILAGAGLPAPLADPILAANWDTTLAVFAAAGRWDFNYEEVLDLDGQLDRVGFPHHVRYFDGPHSWFPDSLATAALEFMSLHAMRTGLAPVDRAFVVQQRSQRVAAAERATEDGNLYAAWRWYRSTLDDLDGLLDVSDARAEYDALTDNRAVRREIERRERGSVAFARRLRRFGELRNEVRAANGPPDADHIVDALDIDELMKTAEEKSGTYEGDVARRILEAVFVSVSFYDPRSFLAAGDWTRALVVLKVAHRIRPEHPRVCFDLARVHARSDAPEAAIDAIRCALAGGQITPEVVRSHPDLQSLSAREDFLAILDGRNP